ncbi:acyl-CoA dehydrogenase family protein [Nocardia sp. NPDC059239]|uniref:acyl-CoA dehydrogenase family protein n=1 Tax=unclassified Nocardia TaxID=2637762 RepID=UPI0036C8A3CA
MTTDTDGTSVTTEATWNQDQYLSSDEIMQRVRALGPVIAADAAEMEREQQLTANVLAALVDSGAFRIGFPASWGGPEMRLDQQVELLEELAYHDGSTAWNVTILADAGMFASLLPYEVARELYASMDMPTSATMHPIGRAERIEGGYRLSGTWAFGTGIRNCDLAVASFHKYDDGQVVCGPDGKPQTWMAWVPKRVIETHDTWFTTGLNGSGSTGWSVSGYEIPEHLLFPFGELFEGAPERHRLMRYYAVFIANQAGVPLGLVKRALDELQEYLSADAKSHRGATLKSRTSVQVAFAEAHGLWQAARASTMSLFSEVSDALWADEPLSAAQEAALTSAPIITARLCWQAMDLIMEIFGSRSILQTEPYERIFRDMATAVRHRYFRKDHLELAGRQLLEEPLTEELAG